MLRQLAKLLAALTPGATLRRHQLYHSGATYLGNNRILTKCVIDGAVIGFIVHADDLLLTPWLILSGEYDTSVTNFFLRHLKPDSRCVDVGANFGFFTCLMARVCRTGKVIGIEPDEPVYALLRDNVFINNLQSRATARQAAASDVPGRLTLHRRVTRSGNTSIARMSDDLLEYLGEHRGEAFEVDAIRLDDLLPEFDNRIDFIKIDVEGAEPLVLRGAAQTIAANPQIKIVMEWSPGQIRAAGFDVAEFLREIAAMGLQSSDIRGSRMRRLPLPELLDIEYRSGILLHRVRG